MHRWRGKNAVVTGAAAGIGQAITQALLKNGINVVGLDIQYERLMKAAEEARRNENWGELHPRRCDVGNKIEIEDAFSWMERTVGGVDIMVNNAGVISYERVIDSNWMEFEKLLNINVLAVAVCIKRAVSSMRSRNVEGHILNINSILGHEIPQESFSDIDGCNGWNLYPSTKHATVALTHTVREEIRAANLPIRITSISPGIVQTEICQHTKLKDIYQKVPSIRPSDIADAVIYALSRRPDVQVREITVEASQYQA